MTDTTARSALWKSIAQTLSDEIAKGHYQPGDKLPTEAHLSTRFGVNRHTIRHATQSLVQDGVLHSRRGSGVYVVMQPTEYPLGRRVRFHQNITASGRTASRSFSRLETRASDPTEADGLNLESGAFVHVVEGTSMADDQPVAVFLSVFPAERFPALLVQIENLQSITAALGACGVEDYTRQSTRITAGVATTVQGISLRLAEGAPVLRTEAINVDSTGRPVEYGITWFAGDRVTLTYAPE
ncbi:MAG: phosphonate metabolism transcriptional regulator PhnF [Pseudotabrizicola sp.]|uniref:phosphonate metabolism transcriptional regulator PhnF n=1 Tax=Pseudotabrizicola sp. TaxID=2939647 RepID=UPI00272930BD|nr:phosphonate metabolism transcriptional regulator PhnF [Pseudotabrizicola sp.]MDO8884639.1 phosphonate metabolism transcriptional regulator PhnF [Pseudotabrizicola sp.]MDP2083384.1 phosphonate metabolism transcriptional regulator PhnF [Pseudotabrizicola sp.]MDZ7574922.1 phosphonate metabolism transcriptional regulator PhnF [Pseudotabrizicola sp.]